MNFTAFSFQLQEAHNQYYVINGMLERLRAPGYEARKRKEP
jgi:hypothetical protein